MPEFPKLPKIDKNPLKTASGLIREAVSGIQEAAAEIDSAVKGIDSEVRAPIEEGKPPHDDVKSLEKFAAIMTAPVATACVPCAVGHFSTSAGLLKEAIRFKGEGITSNEVLNRIAMALEEQNTLERVDLAPEQIQSLPPWEIELAEEALLQSRQLRHNLENLRNIEQLGQTAADSETVYKKLFREWFKQRFAHLGPEKAQIIADKVDKLSPEDKERVLKRAEELVEEV